MGNQPLPFLLSTVAEELGSDAALRLAKILGGQEITVPNVARGSRLAGKVGEDIAEIIVREFAAETIYVPKSMNRSELTRNLIQNSPDASANDLVALTGLSVRQIYRIRSDQRTALPDATQPSLPLFDEH